MTEGLYGEIAVVGGTCHPQLTAEICAYLRVHPTPVSISKFRNQNIFVQLQQSVRGSDVFLVQPLGQPVNEMIMELLITMDALRRDSAARITAVIPYYAYGRTDKKDQPRVPITARLLADLISVAGADRVLTLDLHAGQIQGFFTIPTDELTARFFLLKSLRKLKLHQNAVFVAPDIGAVRRTRFFAEALDKTLAIIEKRRPLDGSHTEVLNLIGDVKDRTCILIDDEIDSASTMCLAAARLKEAGAGQIIAVATHAVFSDPATDNLATAAIDHIVVTNSLPIAEHTRARLAPKLIEVKIGPLLGESIHRIHQGMSVGAIYHEGVGGGE